MGEIVVRLMALPAHVRAFTMLDAQGDYNVYINEVMSYEQRLRSFAHEMRHIENGDFGKELSAAEAPAGPIGERIVTEKTVQPGRKHQTVDSQLRDHGEKAA